MIIELYNIKCDLITTDDLEKLRQWRNSDYVRSKMLYQQIITPEQQLAWYNSIDLNKNYYFIISSGNVMLGICSFKNVDFINKTTEAGIFFIDEKYANGEYPLNCILFMLEMSFCFFGLDEVHTRVLKNNQIGFDFNTSLGFVPVAETVDYIDFVLTRKTGLNTALKLRKAFAKLYKASPTEKLKISIGDNPFLQQVYNNLADKEYIALC